MNCPEGINQILVGIKNNPSIALNQSQTIFDGEISGSHSSEYENDCLLECCIM
jgi:hypothetical protein